MTAAWVHGKLPGANAQPLRANSLDMSEARASIESMFDQIALEFDTDEFRSGVSMEQRPRVRRRRERARDVSAAISYSRNVTARKRREADAQRALARAHRATIEAQRFREYVQRWSAHGEHTDSQRSPGFTPLPTDRE